MFFALFTCMYNPPLSFDEMHMRDQPPPEFVWAQALQIPALSNGGLPFLSAFCIFQGKEQVISTFSLGIFCSFLSSQSPR